MPNLCLRDWNHEETLTFRRLNRSNYADNIIVRQEYGTQAKPSCGTVWPCWSWVKRGSWNDFTNFSPIGLRKSLTPTLMRIRTTHVNLILHFAYSLQHTFKVHQALSLSTKSSFLQICWTKIRYREGGSKSLKLLFTWWDLYLSTTIAAKEGWKKSVP